MSKTNGVTLGQKYNQKFGFKSSNPGPGQYENSSKRPLSGAKIGKA